MVDRTGLNVAFSIFDPYQYLAARRSRSPGADDEPPAAAAPTALADLATLAPDEAAAAVTSTSLADVATLAAGPTTAAVKSTSLANLATLAAARPQTISDRGSCGAIDENEGHAAKPAKAANTVKAEALNSEPLFLRDGRRMCRFRVNTVPARSTEAAYELISQTRHRGAVLVADGPHLIVVEAWGKLLPPPMLEELAVNAGEVIAALREGLRARCAAAPQEERVVDGV